MGIKIALRVSRQRSVTKSSGIGRQWQESTLGKRRDMCDEFRLKIHKRIWDRAQNA